jgi:hypothetical protein
MDDGYDLFGGSCGGCAVRDFSRGTRSAQMACSSPRKPDRSCAISSPNRFGISPTRRRIDFKARPRPLAAGPIGVEGIRQDEGCHRQRHRRSPAIRERGDNCGRRLVVIGFEQPIDRIDRIGRVELRNQFVLWQQPRHRTHPWQRLGAGGHASWLRVELDRFHRRSAEELTG